MPRVVAVIFSTRGNSLNARHPGPKLLIVSLVLKLVFHPGELKMRLCRWLIFKGLVEYLENALWASLLSLLTLSFWILPGPSLYVSLLWGFLPKSTLPMSSRSSPYQRLVEAGG